MRAQAIAFSWDEADEYSTGEWRGSGEADTPAQTRPDVRPASVLPTSRAKPLKINRDLLLVSNKPLGCFTVHCIRLDLFADCPDEGTIQRQ